MKSTGLSREFNLSISRSNLAEAIASYLYIYKKVYPNEHIKDIQFNINLLGNDIVPLKIITQKEGKLVTNG